MVIQTRKCIDMFISCIYIPDHKHVYTLYIHGIYTFQQTYTSTYSEISVHVHMLYRHASVYYMFSHFHACTSLSVQVTYLLYTSTDILSNAYTMTSPKSFPKRCPRSTWSIACSEKKFWTRCVLQNDALRDPTYHVRGPPNGLVTRLKFGKRTLMESTPPAFHFCTLKGKSAGCHWLSDSAAEMRHLMELSRQRKFFGHKHFQLT